MPALSELGLDPGGRRAASAPSLPERSSWCRGGGWDRGARLAAGSPPQVDQHRGKQYFYSHRQKQAPWTWVNGCFRRT